MKKYLYILIAYFEILYCYGQLPPTYWPSLDKTSFDFRFEPPQIDTFDYLPQNRYKYSYYVSPTNSITTKNGSQIGVLIDTSAYNPNSIICLLDKNKRLIKNLGYSNTNFFRPKESGFISFDDSTHYFFHRSGGENTFVTAGNAGFAYTLNFYKLSVKNNKLDYMNGQSMNLKIQIGMDGYVIVGEDTILPIHGSSLFLRDRNKVYLLVNGRKKNAIDSISVCQLEIDRDLNVISNKFIYTVPRVNNGYNEFANVLCINKSNSMILLNKLYDSNNNLDTLVLLTKNRTTNSYVARRINIGNYSYNGQYVDNRNSGFCFSPNDTFIYTLITDTTNGGYYEDFLIQINVNTGFTNRQLISIQDVFKSSPGPNKLSIAPNGKIYIRSRTGNLHQPYQYQVVEQPNRAYPDYKLKFNVYTSAFDSSAEYRGWPQIFNSSNKTPANPFYVYTEPKNRDCKGIHFTNLSDTIFKKFTWYWGDGDSLITVDSQINVTHQYKSKGMYYLKVKGELSSGYWAWYSDSIIYLDPNFYSKDSIGCQWVAQIFYDSTFLDANYTTAGIQWTWYFGDGDSLVSDKPKVTHVYRKSGTYDVTMKIDYGYCSDAISKKSVIYILPAPKPGFTLDKKYACLPPNPVFIVSDTLTQLVSKKTYRFDENTLDSLVDINQHNIPHPYTEIGSKKITQILYSPSGCVSEYSDFVYVYENLSQKTPELPAVNVNNKGSIDVFWNKVPYAKSYILWKGENNANLLYLSNILDTFYNDYNTPNTNKSTYQYALQAVDWCNNNSNLGNAETSLLLAAKNNHNAYSTLVWNKGNAKQFNFRYDIDKIQNSRISNINNIHTNSFDDYEFYSDSSANTCYRITTIQQDGHSIHSNETCLGYEPFVIIPSFYDVYQYENGLPIRAFYLKEFNIEIFDMLGRKVFDGININNWNGNNQYTQYFIYRVSGISKDSKPFNQIGKILLVK